METKKTPIREYIARRVLDKINEEEAKLDKVEQENLDKVREEFYLK